MEMIPDYVPATIPIEYLLIAAAVLIGITAAVIFLKYFRNK